MFTSSEYELIRLLVERSLPKVKDKPEVVVELESILEKIGYTSIYALPISITSAEIGRVNTLVTSIEDNIQKYVKLTGGANLQILEGIKKEITGEMAYLSSFRDKFIYELEFLEDVFKKEIFSRLVQEISSRDGVSITQAEKIVNIDENYIRIRRDLHKLRQLIGGLKTKYSFFEKSLQLIIQSVSVAGKEIHNAKMDN